MRERVNKLRNKSVKDADTLNINLPFKDKETRVYL